MVTIFTSGGGHLLADVIGRFTDSTTSDTDDGLFVPLAFSTTATTAPRLLRAAQRASR
ncbi:MAG: hypothetical protein ACJAR2_004188 [Ilumatobacter sp.]|jgi:hypothetical protein